jgi:hypothetical protein
MLWHRCARMHAWNLKFIRHTSLFLPNTAIFLFLLENLRQVFVFLPTHKELTLFSVSRASQNAPASKSIPFLTPQRRFFE